LRLPLIVLLAAAAAVHAEPSSQVKWLMNEPVTLWDLGLYNTEKTLRQAIDTDGDFNYPMGLASGCSVIYDWETNRITLELWVLRRADPDNLAAGRNKLTIKQAKMIAAEVFRDVRSAFTHRNDGTSTVASGFQHRGFVGRTEPPGIAEEMGRITQIQLLVIGEASWEFNGPLLGDKITEVRGETGRD
jgi:hypothetical protein